MLSDKETKNIIFPFVATSVDLEGIMPNEISQTEKAKYYMISFIYRINKIVNRRKKQIQRYREQTRCYRGKGKYRDMIVSAINSWV